MKFYTELKLDAGLEDQIKKFQSFRGSTDLQFDCELICLDEMSIQCSRDNPQSDNSLFELQSSNSTDSLSFNGAGSYAPSLTRIAEYQSSSQGQSSQQNSRNKYSYRNRNRKTTKTKLQRLSKGYWTKNLLPLVKFSVFKFFNIKLGQLYIQSHKTLSLIKQKNGITMSDFLVLYSLQELKNIWIEYFQQKVLYRDLLVSRANEITKYSFLKVLYRFQEAFEAGVFDHLA